MTKFLIMNPKGEPVQTWTFAWKPLIIFCKSFDWAMKFDTEEAAKSRLAYLMSGRNKFCNNKGLHVVRVTETRTLTIG